MKRTRLIYWHNTPCAGCRHPLSPRQPRIQSPNGTTERPSMTQGFTVNVRCTGCARWICVCPLR
eukprot:scaffold99379_cov57-Phaeocystis_antarctica.AAC.1